MLSVLITALLVAQSTPDPATAALPGAPVAERTTAAKVSVEVTQRYLVPLCLNGAPVKGEERRWELDQKEQVLAFTMQNRPYTRRVPAATPGIAVVRFTPEPGHRYEVEVRTSSPSSYGTRVWQRGEWKPVVRDRTVDRIVSGDAEWVESCTHG